MPIIIYEKDPISREKRQKFSWSTGEGDPMAKIHWKNRGWLTIFPIHLIINP